MERRSARGEGREGSCVRVGGPEGRERVLGVRVRVRVRGFGVRSSVQQVDETAGGCGREHASLWSSA